MTEAGTVPTALPRFPMYNSDAVISTVQIFPKGTGNDLHTHPAQDGYWLVLGGRAKFLGEGDVVLADLGKYEGRFGSPRHPLPLRL